MRPLTHRAWWWREFWKGFFKVMGAYLVLSVLGGLLLGLFGCGAGTEPEHCSTQPACLANPQGQFRSLTPHGIVLVPCACEVRP